MNDQVVAPQSSVGALSASSSTPPVTIAQPFITSGSSPRIRFFVAMFPIALASGDSTTASAASAVCSPVPRSSDSPNARTSPPRAIATPRISRGRSGSSGRNNAASSAT